MAVEDFFDLLLRNGWLSRQPENFQQKVLQHCIIQQFGTGATVYAIGDPPGGIYGIIEGTVAVSIAPGRTGPHLAHLAQPGSWFGDAPFLTGEPRRVHLEAVTSCRLAHLPISAMEMFAKEDSNAIRYFARISVYNVDHDLRVVEDLLHPAPKRRISAVLWRSSEGLADNVLVTTQAGLSQLANASRKETIAALKELSAMGAVRPRYRAIEIVNRTLLRQVADGIVK